MFNGFYKTKKELGEKGRLYYYKQVEFFRSINGAQIPFDEIINDAKSIDDGNEYLMCTPKIITSDRNCDCNASLFIKDCLEYIWDDLDDEQRADIERAKANGWMVRKGESCRAYMWDAGGAEEIECFEIPEIHQICIEFDMYAN